MIRTTSDDTGQSGIHTEIPDRACTWCKVPMKKRLVAGGLFIHYTCPKCVFQHTSKRAPKAG